VKHDKVDGDQQDVPENKDTEVNTKEEDTEEKIKEEGPAQIGVGVLPPIPPGSNNKLEDTELKTKEEGPTQIGGGVLPPIPPGTNIRQGSDRVLPTLGV